MTFRVAEMQNCAYTVDDYESIQNRSAWKWIHKSRPTPLTGIKLLHLATRPSLESRYGELIYKIPYDVIIKNYLLARRDYSKEKDKIKSVEYRVACSQIHRLEINHMVIVCCKGDEELENFPILCLENQTRHFTPSEDTTTMGTSHSAKMLQYLYTDNRYENLTLSLYLPNDCLLSLSQDECGQDRVYHNPEWCHKKFKTPFFKGHCPSEQ